MEECFTCMIILHLLWSDNYKVHSQVGEKGKQAVFFEQRLSKMQNITKLQITENPQQSIFLPVIAGCTDVKSILYIEIKTKQKIANIVSCHSEGYH